MLVAALAACTEPSPQSGAGDVESTIRGLTIPEELAAGEAAFRANCATCHGERALGTERGPPLVHIVYEPSHHADVAFYLAIDRGVRAHHWSFGDMPPQPQVDRSQAEAIVRYVRFLQQQVGIE